VGIVPSNAQAHQIKARPSGRAILSGDCQLQRHVR
jgi:hypothetical protein